MSMTKAERAALESALTDAAFRRTFPVLPDVPVPPLDEKSRGYVVRGKYLERAWSENFRHGYEGSNSVSQRGIEMHSTAERALRAHRYEREQEMAKELRAIDIRIAESIGKAQP